MKERILQTIKETINYSQTAEHMIKAAVDGACSCYDDDIDYYDCNNIAFSIASALLDFKVITYGQYETLFDELRIVCLQGGE